MSIVQSVTDWLNAYYPHYLEDSSNVVSKKKAGKKEKSKVVQEHPVVDWLIKKLSDGTVSLYDGGRVLFVLTKHECKCRLEDMEAYLQGKAYRKALKSAKPKVDLDKYAPHIVAHKSSPNMLYCLLTLKTLNNDIDEVERHVKGRSYSRIIGMLNAEEARIAEKRALRKRNKAFGTMADDDMAMEGDEFEGEEGDILDMLMGMADEDEDDMFFEDEDEDDLVVEEVESESEEEVIPPPKKAKTSKGAQIPAKQPSPVKPVVKQNKPKRK